MVGVPSTHKAIYPVNICVPVIFYITGYTVVGYCLNCGEMPFRMVKFMGQIAGCHDKALRDCLIYCLPIPGSPYLNNESYQGNECGGF